MTRRFAASVVVMTTILAGPIVLAGTEARSADMDSYWYGFTIGSGATVCELLKGKILNRVVVKDFLNGLKAGSDIPAGPKARALEELSKLYKSCPLK